MTFSPFKTPLFKTAAICAALMTTVFRASAEPLPPEAKAAMANGAPFVKVWYDKTNSDGAIDVISAIDVTASRDDLWAIMTDCGATLKVIDDLKSCEVLEAAPDGSWDIRKHKSKVNMVITAKIVFRSDYDPLREIKVSKVSGDMKVQDATWTLTDQGNGVTRVSYRSRSAPNFPVSKKKLQKAARKDIPKIMTRLKTLAENR